jgi:hypothetical protein
MDLLNATEPDRTFEQVRDLADALEARLRAAGVLARAGRRIDLTGLEQEAELVCASALNLGSAARREVRPCLMLLLREIDALAASLQPP